MIDLDAIFADDPLPILPVLTAKTAPAEPTHGPSETLKAPETAANEAVSGEPNQNTPLNRRNIAWQALLKLEPDAATRAKVWRQAEQEERNWGFLVRNHGYPAGWFLFAHVDNHLRLHRGKGIATESVDGDVAAWWIVDAPIADTLTP